MAKALTKPRSWDPDEDRIIRESYNDPTVTNAQIGEFIGRSKEAVDGRAKKLGLKKTQVGRKFHSGRGVVLERLVTIP